MSAHTPIAEQSLRAVPADDMLLDIIGHLGTAISQSIPTDDQNIMGHVRSAHDLARLLRKANQ